MNTIQWPEQYSFDLGERFEQRRHDKKAEMDADHVSAWVKGGSTNIKNCQMLCRTHNRVKGNR